MGDAADADVLVVGAGPVGLLLAGEVSAGGARTVVLEQLPEPTAESRASILHARTMEIFADLGILDRLGNVPDGGRGHFGGIPLDLAEAAPGHVYAGQWECLQSRLEPVLEEWATGLGAEILRGHRVVGLMQDDHRVEVAAVGPDGRNRRFTAAYAVGCDGERSTVRQLAGFDVTREDATRQMLRADVRGIDIPERRLKRYPDGTATAHHRGGGVTRLMVHDRTRPPGARTREPDFADVAAAWERVTGEDISTGTAVWLNSFDNTRHQAARYRHGRVFLAGDSAHTQMPVGGQALNLGLQDAAGLAPKLVAEITGEAADSCLDDYQAERHPVGARALTNIQAQAALLFGGPEVDGMREVFGELLAMDVVRRHLALMISGLDTPPAPPAARRDLTRTLPAHGSSTMDRLTGKTALVTGSSRGIGRATAVRLAREGALVAVHYATNDLAAQETVALIEKEGGRAFPVRAELGVPGDVHELFVGLERGLKERTGRTALDIVVNNAAVTGADGIPPEDVTPEQLDRYFAVNAKAPYLIVQRALKNMPDGGRVINISSALTRTAVPEQVAYSMTKGAIEQISLHLAKHLAPRRITVNSVAPGITDNGGPVFDIPEAVEQMAQVSAFNRVGDAGDVADVVTFLATDEARWITGSFVDASGGTLLG
ncbi:SDR family oxidoreductase [Streptomyces pinistramenti]|uniref:SDR family oxidoreductase n=1 Tax=Streptomyces pinistramenti TaxID=2884812 RepID=UPI001D06D557|nr:SDR family oxidoreductase [Streptomyces pinistramenti]MCB5909992.1 SDR family oxidoreductase [Streptomyces pinistramenti]